MSMRTYTWHGLLLTALLTASNGLGATGLQVAPISLQLQAAQAADGLWLSNTGDAALHAQVRVYHWTQNGGEEQLTASRGLVISPPMLALAVDDRQLVRVIRVGAPPSGASAVEDAYRVVIDELPVAGEDDKSGLQYVLRYSVPVFVEPVGKATVTPHLAWSLSRDGEHAVLEISNDGDGHAQLSALGFTDRAGKHTVVNTGLFGYVLPGGHMRWVLKAPAETFVGGGTFDLRINGNAAQQPVAMGATAR